MKALIAATCVAVLCAVVFYFFQEYRAGVRRAEIAEFLTLKRRCLVEVDAFAKATPSSEPAEFLANCLAKGAVNQDDLDAALIRNGAHKL